MTTTEQKQKQEMVLPSFFYAIASSESRQLISLDELQRIITLDAMTQARTEDTARTCASAASSLIKPR